MKTTLLFFAVMLGFIYTVSSYMDDPLVQLDDVILVGAQHAYNCVAGGTVFFSFKGIPYAKPPVGNLRFKAPEAPDSSKDRLRYFQEYQAVCPQYNLLSQEFDGSEDCLYLNVFVPELGFQIQETANVDEYLNVCVFIGSYAFMFDGESQDFYIPEHLVSQDCIVVTFNFRLDSLGFLDLGSAEVPGNAGLKDQVAALKWVQKNIEKFGGDPNKVTLIGHSSGSAAAILHAVSPMSKGLFRRVITLSGTPSCDAIYSISVKEKSYELARQLGSNATEASDVLTFLQSVEEYDNLLAKPNSKNMPDLIKKIAQLVQVVEEDYGQERFLTDFPVESLKLGNVNDVDIMFSYSSQETLLVLPQLESLMEDYNKQYEMWLPSKILIKTTPETSVELGKKVKEHYFGDNNVTNENFPDFIKYTNVVSINMEVLKTVSKWSTTAKTFLFRFSSDSFLNRAGSNGEKYGIEGPGHGDILNYLFCPSIPGSSNSVDVGSTEYDMVEQLVTALMNFVKYGEPSPNGSLGIKWPQYNNECKAYADFTDTITIYNNPQEEEIAFWENIFIEADVDDLW